MLDDHRLELALELLIALAADAEELDLLALPSSALAGRAPSARSPS